MNNSVSRQVRRATERRENKPDADTISRTSRRHMGRTKGEPFSKMTLVSITKSKSGVPAIFHVKSPTRGTRQSIKATMNNITWFVKGLTPQMHLSMLGAY